MDIVLAVSWLTLRAEIFRDLRVLLKTVSLSSSGKPVNPELCLPLWAELNVDCVIPLLRATFSTLLLASSEGSRY